MLASLTHPLVRSAWTLQHVPRPVSCLLPENVLQNILSRSLRTSICLRVQSSSPTLCPVFLPNQRIPKRFKEQIDNVIEDHYEKIELFASVLNCRPALVEKLARSDTRLLTYIQANYILRRLKLLVQFNYAPEEIVMYPNLFSKSSVDMAHRLAIMETVRHYYSTLNLALIPRAVFDKRIEAYKKEAALLGDSGSKIVFLANLLECTESDVLRMIEKGHNHLLTLQPSTLDTLVKLIKEHGYSSQEIRNMPGILHVNVTLAKHRFKVVSELEVKEFMTLGSILIRSNSIFKKSLNCGLLEKSCLQGFKNCNELLMSRLNISEERLVALIKKKPIFGISRARKLTPCLDLLLDKMELRPADVMTHPELTYYSPKRLARRATVLEEAEVHGARRKIVELKLTHKQFESKYRQLIKKLEKENKI